jgi:hypothetical protein
MSYISGNHHRKNSSGGDSVETKRDQYKTTGRQKKAQNFNQAQKKGHSRAGSLNLPSVKLSRKPDCDELIGKLLGHLTTEKADPKTTVKLARELAKTASKKNNPLEVMETLERDASQLPEATWPIIAENLKQTALGEAKDGAFYLQALLKTMTAANAPAPDETAPTPATAGPYGSYAYGPPYWAVPATAPNGSYAYGPPYWAFPATAPYGSYGCAPMEIAVVTPPYWDPNAPSYYQGHYGAFPAYGVPPPDSGPGVAPPQAPPPPIATAPVPITDWKDRMSKRVVELLARLFDGDKVGVGFCFGLLKTIAGEQKFSGDDLDGLIAAALENRTLEELVIIDNYAK